MTAVTASKLPYYAIFFSAGIPALIYQVVWQRVLTLYFGVDIYSAAVTVSTFMLGLGLGSLVGGAIADRSSRPDVLYAGCEGVLAVCGAASLPVFRWVGGALAGAGLAETALAAALLLLVPTLFMGMTLPLMVRTLLARSGSTFGRDLAWLYGANTLGAAAGALLTAYALAGWVGLGNATLLAAALNLLLALLVLWQGRRTPAEPAAPRLLERLEANAGTPLPASRALVLSFLSGLIALGYEIVWYRLITLLLHGTAYVFGTILGVLLLGIGAGSLLARHHIDRPEPARRFGNAQLLVGAYTCVVLLILGHGSGLPGLRHLIAASSFISFHPTPELASGELSLLSLYSLLDTFFWPALMLGVPALAMGYGFPHLIRAAPRDGAHVAQSIGSLYFANIAGATLGSLLVGFVLLEHAGSERALLVLLVLSMLCWALAGGLRGSTRAQRGVVGAGVAAAVLLFPGRGQLLRALHFADSPHVEFFGREDKTGIVALRRQTAVLAFAEERSILGEQRLYIDGARHGRMSDEAEDSVDSDLNVALSAHRSPRRVLSIGLGDGRMVAAALAAPSVTEVIVVELSSGLREVLGRTSLGQSIDASPKLRYENDDGRRWLHAHPAERFDVIMAWPLHAAHAYSGNLYSAEFFQLVRSHLAPGGLYFTRTADAFSTAHTLASVFPHVVRIGDISYVGSSASLEFSAARALRPQTKLATTLKADRATILARAGSAPLVYDFWPRTEYYLTYDWAWALSPRGSERLPLYSAPAGELTALVVP